MAGLLYLQNDDFEIRRGTRGNILCHGIEGFSMILFYSTQCVHCQGLIPIFKRLPGTIHGCQFGMVNVSTFRDIIAKSRQTIVPINYVPYMIFYYNGKPFMIYKGEYDMRSIQNFIVEMYNNIQRKQEFSRGTVKNVKQETEDSIPEYCTGIPVCSDKVCYLEFMTAYNPLTGNGNASAQNSM